MTTTVRFETLLTLADELAERRRRMMMSTLMASTLCLAAVTFAWVGDSMGISAVAPPEDAYSITLDAIFIPPPPAAPPGAPAAADRSSSERTSKPSPPDPKPAVAPPDVAPLDVPALDLEAAPTRAKIRGSDSSTGDGGPKDGLGPSIGSPRIDGTRCLLPPCLGTGVPTRRPPSAPTPERPALVPYNVAAAGAIYTPDPDQKQLGLTPTGRGTRGAGRTVVGFCINRSGRTYDVRTNRRFGSDPQVDRICRETVSRWRFKPQRVNGNARASCTSVTFDIRFD